MKRSMTIILVGLFVCAGSPPSVGATAEPPSGRAADERRSPNAPAVLEDCQERFVIAPGVEREVRDRVPTGFELRRDNAGRPLLYVTAIRCERYTAGNTPRTTTAAAFAASIEPPDSAACASRWPALGTVAPEAAGTCSFYLLFAAYDNPDVVAWARRGTPHVPVTYVDDLTFTQHDLDPARFGAPFHFLAPSTPSPYEMDLIVRERPVELPLTGTFWHSSPTGTVRFRFETDNLAFGEASGSVRTDPGSDMATLFGTHAPTPSNGFPLLAGTRWNHGTITKTVFDAVQADAPRADAVRGTPQAPGSVEHPHPDTDDQPAAHTLPATGGGLAAYGLVTTLAPFLIGTSGRRLRQTHVPNRLHEGRRRARRDRDVGDPRPVLSLINSVTRASHKGHRRPCGLELGSGWGERLETGRRRRLT